MIDEHICVRFHLIGQEVEGAPGRHWEETVVVPLSMETWDGLRAGLGDHGGAEAHRRAAFEHVRPQLAGEPISVQFFRVTRIVVDTVIGKVGSGRKKSDYSPIHWLTGKGPYDADAVAEAFPTATHAVEHLRETDERVILVNGFLHEFGPDDHRVDWEEAHRRAEPSHRLLTVEGGFHPPIDTPDYRPIREL